MKKILIAVDDTKGSRAAMSTCVFACKCMRPEAVLLLYVEKFEGRSLMDEMLGDAEMTTLRKVLNGSDFKKKLDEKANAILNYYKSQLEKAGVAGVKPILKAGHPAEEILKTAKEEGAEMIIIGSRGKRVSRRFMGSVSREVANDAEVPVLLVK